VRIDIKLQDALDLAHALYPGKSGTLSKAKKSDSPWLEGWWRSAAKNEAVRSDRHLAGLRLYLALGAHALPPVEDRLPPDTFPSSFDFSDNQIRNPDKGLIKACLVQEPAILKCWIMKGHLLFQLTDAGSQLLRSG
jgi:hypothetical protein